MPGIKLKKNSIELFWTSVPQSALQLKTDIILQWKHLSGLRNLLKTIYSERSSSMQPQKLINQ